MVIVVAFGLLGCDPAGFEVTPGKVTDPSPDDSATTGDDSGGTADDSGPVDTSPPEPETDFSTWTGTRRFTYSDFGLNCDETVNESGSQLLAGDDFYDALAADCTTCTLFFVVQPETDTVCSVIGLGTTYRAVFLSDAGAVVNVYTGDSDGSVSQIGSDTSGSFDGEDLAFTYTFSYYGAQIGVEGLMTFPQN
ncbi:MAG TPA: hypothetical protein PLA94_00840 [Myxococcota bacterium]|nr:hypothetical protein [Myxococcota bacterium]